MNQRARLLRRTLVGVKTRSRAASSSSTTSPLSRASTPACSCARNALSLSASSRLRCWSTRNASRTASLAFWYSPVSTTSSTKASCSGVRLMLRVGTMPGAYRGWQTLPNGWSRSWRAGDLPQEAAGHEPVAAGPDDRGVEEPAENARHRRVPMRAQAVAVEDERQRVAGEAAAPAQGELPAGLDLDH